jgi:hypothetical protein
VPGVEFERLEAKEVLVPANTAEGSPQITDLSFPAGEVAAIEVVIPPGHQGFTGFALEVAGQPILPRGTGDFIVASGEVIEWPVVGYPPSGDWSIRAYNTDVLDHTFYLRFYIRELISVPVPAGVPVPVPEEGPGFFESFPPGELPPLEEELPPLEEFEEELPPPLEEEEELPPPEEELPPPEGGMSEEERRRRVEEVMKMRRRRR